MWQQLVVEVAQPGAGLLATRRVQKSVKVMAYEGGRCYRITGIEVIVKGVAMTCTFLDMSIGD